MCAVTGCVVTSRQGCDSWKVSGSRSRRGGASSHSSFVRFPNLKFLKLFFAPKSTPKINILCLEYNEAVHQLFIDFKKAYDSVRREVLYNILMEFGVTKKLVRLIKMCLTETYSKVRVGKNLSDVFPIRNGLRQGDALSPLLFNFALEYAIRRVQVNQDDLKLNGTHQLLAYADDVNILGGSAHTVKENAEALVVATKETGLEVNADKIST